MSVEIKLWFYERVVAESGLYHYPFVEAADRIDQPVPVVGDLVSLEANVYTVLARNWMYPSYGSMAWPQYNRPGRVTVEILVERRESGLFVNEAPTEDDEDEES